MARLGRCIPITGKRCLATFREELPTTRERKRSFLSRYCLEPTLGGRRSEWICGYGCSMSRCCPLVLNPLLPNAVGSFHEFMAFLLSYIYFGSTCCAFIGLLRCVIFSVLCRAPPRQVALANHPLSRTVAGCSEHLIQVTAQPSGSHSYQRRA